MATPSPRQGSGRRLLVLMLMSHRPPPRAAWAPCPLGAHRGQGTTQVANRGFKMCLHHVYVYLFPSHKELCMPSKQKSMKPPCPRLDS